EIIEQAVEITDGWYADGPIDWDDVWDRLERSRLADGRGIDLGNDQDTPAMRKIRRETRKRRREGEPLPAPLLRMREQGGAARASVAPDNLYQPPPGRNLTMHTTAAIRAAAAALQYAGLDNLVHTLLDAMDRDDLAEIHTAEEI